MGFSFRLTIICLSHSVQLSDTDTKLHCPPLFGGSKAERCFTFPDVFGPLFSGISPARPLCDYFSIKKSGGKSALAEGVNLKIFEYFKIRNLKIFENLGKSVSK